MKRLLPVFVLGWVAAAQTLTVPVSRTLNLALDEAQFTMTLGATLDSTVQQVKQALEDAGLPNPTVVVLGLDPDPTNRSAAPQVLYQATLTIAAGSARDAAKRLDTLRTQLAPPLKSLAYAATLQTSQSAIDVARQSVLPQVLADARTQAQRLAAAAGVKLGNIRAISDTPAGYYGIPTVARLGDFSASPFINLTSGYTFSFTVIFGTTP